jgi:hypothetical protein
LVVVRPSLVTKQIGAFSNRSSLLLAPSALTRRRARVAMPSQARPSRVLSEARSRAGTASTDRTTFATTDAVWSDLVPNIRPFDIYPVQLENITLVSRKPTTLFQTQPRHMPLCPGKTRIRRRRAQTRECTDAHLRQSGGRLASADSPESACAGTLRVYRRNSAHTARTAHAPAAQLCQSCPLVIRQARSPPANRRYDRAILFSGTRLRRDCGVHYPALGHVRTGGQPGAPKPVA